jgi:hypothetical protein
MQEIKHYNYDQVIDSPETIQSTVELVDHLCGFESDLSNPILDSLQKYADQVDQNYTVILTNPIMPAVQAHYPRLLIKYHMPEDMFDSFETYNIHPEISYKNFICSFNGSPHVGRKLLVSILHKFGYFNSNYCSKNFVFSEEILNGHIRNYTGDQESFYSKFFATTEDFLQTVYSFGHLQYDHKTNIQNLESKITESFIHLVSETVSTGYHPFVTEKFLYSVVTRGLFICNAQPGYHDYLEKYFGFKKYNSIFDYSFDQIQNPVERVVALMSMLSKFSYLTPAEWHDLRLLEQDTIEYNYNHYYSGQYLKHLQEKLQEIGLPCLR